MRGVEPAECVVVAALVEAGFGAIEVPLNSPEACKSIASLAEKFGEQILIGAGTVLSLDDAMRVAEAGARRTSTGEVVARAGRGCLAVLPIEDVIFHSHGVRPE